MTWPGACEQVDLKTAASEGARVVDGCSAVRAQRRTGQALALEAEAAQVQMSAPPLRLGSVCFQK